MTTDIASHGFGKIEKSGKPGRKLTGESNRGVRIRLVRKCFSRQDGIGEAVVSEVGRDSVEAKVESVKAEITAGGELADLWMKRGDWQIIFLF